MLVRLALAYWAPVFAFAFMLGVARVLWVAPVLGDLGATLAELPLVLGASWLVARGMLGRNPGLSPQQALAIGLLAFAFLMVAELALSLILDGGPGDWLAAMQTSAGAIGLAGQAGFALLPWLLARRGRA